MKGDKESIMNCEVQNEFSGAEEDGYVERILSHSRSSLESDAMSISGGVKESDISETSRKLEDYRDTLTPNDKEKTNGIDAMKSSSATKTYDREAILRKLAGDNCMRKYLLNSARESQAKIETPETKAFEESEDERLESVVEELREFLKAIPDGLLHMMTGMSRPGDCGRPADRKPDWLDMEKLRRGQKFAREHNFSLYLAEMVSVMCAYTFRDTLKLMILTGKSSTPFTAFKRYTSVALKVQHWYCDDTWSKGTKGWTDMLTVRALHVAAKRKLDASTNEEIDNAAKISNMSCPSHDMLLKDFSEACETPAVGQCPFLVRPTDPDRPKSFNQFEVSFAQWQFVWLAICYPQHFGIHNAKEEDLEAYCHLWRSIGYQLGVEDEYNFCRGSLDEIRQCGHDFIEMWVKPHLREVIPEWEHMMRCIFDGFKLALPYISFETSLLFVCEILDLKMPRLYSSLSYKAWINHCLMKSLFYYGMKLPMVVDFVNTKLQRTLDHGERLRPSSWEKIRIKLEG
ncbi:uncharacterized protein LOC124307627 [Neodiprion virginianus]|uniref:uncharacterized protein LOC124307627 n=1 Tax=Neodiprion virginianus TaxID=2961670 RepID=UPI001EE71B1D|nr:uncharacterized protein LOC124307627 [Neodiprion virginianus]XP_046625479.1 uncharacterized protein LOC124307627 [Neodiprion virginianus]